MLLLSLCVPYDNVYNKEEEVRRHLLDDNRQSNESVSICLPHLEFYFSNSGRIIYSTCGIKCFLMINRAVSIRLLVPQFFTNSGSLKMVWTTSRMRLSTICSNILIAWNENWKEDTLNVLPNPFSFPYFSGHAFSTVSWCSTYLNDVTLGLIKPQFWILTLWIIFLVWSSFVALNDRRIASYKRLCHVLARRPLWRNLIDLSV